METLSKILQQLEEKMCILFDNLSCADMCFEGNSATEDLETERIFLKKILAKQLHEKEEVIVSIRPFVFNKFIELVSCQKKFLSKIFMQGLSNCNQTEI